MKIAFDAKRAYQNSTGLGHYSRTLIASLAKYFHSHQYYLCAPKLTHKFSVVGFDNIFNITPGKFWHKKLRSLWRSKLVIRDLLAQNIDLYHGLSHEIPVGIQKTGIKSVVTIHDLIFERYPDQYNFIDVLTYRRKFRYACKNADRIIAISQQTKKDIVELYGISEEKIDICYQSCNPAFGQVVTIEEKNRIRDLYRLPQQFFLYVGSIIERKNLLNICKALKKLEGKSDVPLVVIGEGGKYKKQVHKYCSENGLTNKVIFLSEDPTISKLPTFKNAIDFPAIYQMATCMIYPSFYEGFGIPVLEALWSRLPVITSNVSCMPETGGDAAYYVNPSDPEELAQGMMQMLKNKTLVDEMKEKGWKYAQNFTPEKGARDVMGVYLKLI